MRKGTSRFHDGCRAGRAPICVHLRHLRFIPCWARGRRPGRVQSSTVQGSGVQRHPVFPSSRLPCSKVVTGCNSVVSVVSCEFSGIMGSSFLSHQKVIAWCLTRSPNHQPNLRPTPSALHPVSRFTMPGCARFNTITQFAFTQKHSWIMHNNTVHG